MGRVQGVGGQGGEFLLYVVYGSNDKGERNVLWNSLKNGYDMVGDEPWVVEGDFNCIGASFESCGGGRPDNGAIVEFNDCVRMTELVEHPHSGSQFTWCRNWKRKGVVGS
ncbi:hypothetical protein LIER_40644 [Lithospermum erythrorhizon]|uniref:Uncharacterized protein n=1 Tax=Lithospermum erythrorhizon TaxID=34254 RepID=A0AAV3QYS7_LITER